MVTKSAFDRTGNLFNYRVYFQGDNSDLYLGKTEGWGQERTRKILPGVDLNAGFRVGQSLGVNINYKNSQLFNDYPRSQYTWEYNPANGGLPTSPALTSWNLQNEQKDTRRQSLSGRIDYRLGPKTKLSLVGQWSYYDLLFTDRTITVNTGNLLPLATTSTPAYGNGTVNGVAGRGSVLFGTINRWKSGVTWDSSINLEHDMEKAGTLTASVYWSQAYSKYRDTTGSWYSDAVMQRTNLTVGFDNIGQVVPFYRVTDSAGATVDLKDTSKFSASQMRSRPQTGVDTRDGFSLDYKLTLPTTMPLAVKAGVRLDDTTRNIENRVYNRAAFTPRSLVRSSSGSLTPAFRTIRSATACRPIIFSAPTRHVRNWAATPSCLILRPATPSPGSTTRPGPATCASISRRSRTSMLSVVSATRIESPMPRTASQPSPALRTASSLTSATIRRSMSSTRRLAVWSSGWGSRNRSVCPITASSCRGRLPSRSRIRRPALAAR
jgi:hypothetical protein